MAVLIPIIGIVAAVASVGVSVYSAVSSSQASSDASREARKLRASQAEQARLAYEQKAADYERRARAALSTERAERGASGIGMEGSPLLTYWENAKVFEEDIARIKQTGDLEQTALAQRGMLESTYVKAEQQAGVARSAQTILGGATDVFTQGRKTGVW